MEIADKVEQEVKERAGLEPKLGDELPEDWLKNAEKEIKTQYRTIVLDTFRGQEKVEVHIHQPTTKEEGFANDAYAKAFTHALINEQEVLTRKQLLKLLSDRKIWGEEEEKKIEDLRDDMRAIELAVAQLRKRGNFNKTVMARHRDTWKQKRSELNSLLTEKNSYLVYTIEGRAEEAEVRTRLSLCVKFPDGQYVWKTAQEIEDEINRGVLVRLVNEAMLFWAGLTQEIIDELPVNFLFGREAIDQKIS